MKKFFLYTSILCVACGTLLASIVFAQGSSGIEIRPSVIEDRVDPGQVLSGTLHVTNLGSDTKTFYMGTRNVVGLRPDGTPVFSEPGEATLYEVSSWIKLPADPITIGAGATVEVPFVIMVPDIAGPGGHYGVIFLSSEAVRPETIGAGVGYEVGAIVNLRISGDADEEAQIRAFQVDKNIYNTAKPEVRFTTRVANTGNVIARPRGPIEVTNGFGKKVGTLIINSPGGAVFPGSEREFEALWQSDSFSIGPHRAAMSLVYGEDERITISAAVSFWVMPFNILFSALGILLVIFGGIYVAIRRYIRKKVSLLGATPGGGREPMVAPRLSLPYSRLMFTSIILLVFVLLFLVVLFLLFA